MKKIVVVLLILVLVGGGVAYAYANKLGPFASNNNSGSTQMSSDPLQITKLTQNKDILTVKLKKNIKEDGYCILEMRSKRAALTIDDSKVKKQKGNSMMEDCEGWNINTKTMLSGEYKVTVKFVGKKSNHTATGTVTLK